MKNVKLNTVNGKSVLVNWDNVNFVQDATSQWREGHHTEINCGDQTIDVVETIEEIESKLQDPEVISQMELLEEEARMQYDQLGSSGPVTERLR